MEGERRDFLPPQPAGPEPELGRGGPPPPSWTPPQPTQPDNGAAVAGFVLSLCAAGFLLVLFWPISLVLGILGTIFARQGKQRVSRGETSKHAGLAQAGFIVGIVSIVLALVELAGCAVLIATDEDLRDDIEREFDNTESVRAVLRIAAAAGRALLG